MTTTPPVTTAKGTAENTAQGSPDASGHVVLHHAAVFVEDFDLSVAFYADVLGFEVAGRAHLSELGIEQVFLSAGREHHDLVLARRLDGGVVPADKRELFHLAFELPRDRPLEAFLERISRGGINVVAGPMEHPALLDGSGSRTAVYVRDPDGHILEVTKEH